MLPMIKLRHKAIVYLGSGSFGIFQVQKYTQTTAISNNTINDNQGAWASF